MFQFFSKIWIVVAVAVFAVAGIFCWQYFDTVKEKASQDIEQEKIIKNGTADWEIYRNEEHGFEIKYPPTYDKENYIECRPKVVEEKNQIIIFIGPLILKILDSQGLELFEYTSQYKKDWQQVQNFGPIENIFVNGKDAVKIVSEFIGASYSEPQDIFVKSRDKIYHFNYDDYILSNCLYEVDQLPSNVAEKMLSTFRFIKIEKAKNPFIGFFENAELQYETEIQKENISTALNDILNLSEEQLKRRKYEDYTGKKNQWDLHTLIIRHFVFEEPYERGMGDFYHNVKSEEVQNQVKKILTEFFEEQTLPIINREQEAQEPYNEQQQRDARRKADIGQIVMALEIFYSEIGEYAQIGGIATMPSSIGVDGFLINESVMTDISKDSASGKSYIWIDNTKDSSKFCVYAELEQGGYYAGSHKGKKALDFSPKTLSCW